MALENFVNVRDLARLLPLSERALWHLVDRKNRQRNGLEAAGAVVQISPRRILIDREKFESWLRAKK